MQQQPRSNLKLSIWPLSLFQSILIISSCAAQRLVCSVAKKRFKLKKIKAQYIAPQRSQSAQRKAKPIDYPNIVLRILRTRN